MQSCSNYLEKSEKLTKNVEKLVEKVLINVYCHVIDTMQLFAYISIIINAPAFDVNTYHTMMLLCVVVEIVNLYICVCRALHLNK